MRWQQLLFAQGFGTRRVCDALLHAGRVARVAANGASAPVVADPDEQVDAHEGFEFEVDGIRWPYRERALLLLNKPAGHECSARPSHHPSVLSLLPAPLIVRGVQPVGRLDEDTTGLLLLTDDGALLHRLTSPRHHVAKVYEVRTALPVDAAQVDALRSGVVLRDDPRPVRAAACEPTGERSLRLTLTEGRYHQVKRMVAAAGNAVVGLHRSAYGALALPPDLAPGDWRWLDGPAAVVGQAVPAPPAAATAAETKADRAAAVAALVGGDAAARPR